MTELRESLAYRFRWYGAVGIGILIGAWLVWARERNNDPTIATLCRVEYQRASSAADAAVVDAQIPSLERRDVPPRVSCGFLRASGRL